MHINITYGKRVQVGDMLPPKKLLIILQPRPLLVGPLPSYVITMGMVISYSKCNMDMKSNFVDPCTRMIRKLLLNGW